MTALGRRVSSDFVHIARYGLTADTIPTKPTPVVAGVNWYETFDQPKYDSKGRFYIIENGDLGKVRGGHCICFKPTGILDPVSWWTFYNQGQEGACVGFGSSRAMSLLHRVRYDAEWLYHQAQLIDEYPDTPPAEGTSVRAAFDVLRTLGPKHLKSSNPTLSEGVSVNRWATSIDEVAKCLGYTPTPDRIPFLNSWGRDYPHIVYIDVEVVARLMSEDGEFTLFTEK